MVTIQTIGISVLTVMVILLFFLWVVKRRKNKKQKQQFKAGDAISDQEIENVNSKKLRILIWRHIGEDLVTQVGYPIIATETKDDNNNLIVVNEEANFKEDFNFSIDRVYEIMNYSLKLQTKTTTEKADIIRKEIKKQEDLLLQIEGDIELNKKYNYQDEEQKLKQLKIFYDTLRKESKGNYMRLGVGGIRQYEFIVIDGILYPYFFGSKRFRVYPDLAIKKKIFNHENTIFRNETAGLQVSLLNWIVVITLAIGVLMVLGNGFWTYKNMQTGNSIAELANQGAITCSNTMAQINNQYGNLVQEYLEQKRIESNKNSQSNSNSNPNNNVGGTVNINPTNIG